jgi:hypothetical protein
MLPMISLSVTLCFGCSVAIAPVAGFVRGPTVSTWNLGTSTWRQTDAGEPEALLRAQLAAEHGLSAESAGFDEMGYTPSDLDPLIRDRIDPGISDGAVSMRGRDLRFTPADGVRRHAGVIVIRYSDARTAADRAKPVLGQRRFFRDTKILTPMIASVRGDTLAIFFTESGGDTKLRAALAGAAARFSGAP